MWVRGAEGTKKLIRGALLLGQEKDREAWRGERFLRSPESPLALGQRCGCGKRERELPLTQGLVSHTLAYVLS